MSEKNINSKTPVMQRTVQEDEIDLLDLAKYYLRHWLVLALAVILGANAGFLYCLFKPYTYTSYASLFIESETTSITSLADIQLGTALSSDFIELAGSRAVIDSARAMVKGEIGREISRKFVKDNCSVTNTAKTRLLVFKVTNTDQELACVLANSMAKATAQEVSLIMKTDEPTFVDSAELESANGKGFTKYTAVCAVGALVFACAILLIPYLTNDRIVTENDIKKYTDANVIGIISIDRAENFKNSKKKR